MKIVLNCCSCLSLVVFTANLMSDWYVYHCEVNPPVPSHLADWWFWLSVVGTVISVIVLLLDLCCCCIALESKQDCDDERVFVSHFVFLATLLEDLPLLILSLVTINSIMSSDSIAGHATVADILFAFKISSGASLVVSVFRLAKVLVLGCKTCDEPFICQCYLCILYFIVFVLSCVVFIYSHAMSNIQMLE